MGEVADRIHKLYAESSKGRSHLGASLAGHECERFLWYTFRWAYGRSVPGRIGRLFQTGFREEARMIEELRRIGLEVHDRTREGTQIRVGDAHFGGSLDGVVRGLEPDRRRWHVLELKTANRSSFDKLVKRGVRAVKPMHWAQMQTYMRFMDMDRALYLVACKDTDDLYDEIVELDHEASEVIGARALRVVHSPTPPPKVAETAEHPPCSWCDAREVCHEGKTAPANCRTCLHSSAVEGGKWICGRHGKSLDEEEQREGCPDHLYIPELIPWADQVDAGDDWVSYQAGGGMLQFANCGESGMPPGLEAFSSAELQHLDAPKAQSEAVRRLRAMGGRVVK